MATAIEDSGFEIRDMIQWLCAQGHPFSHDVGLAIDKFLGAKREVVGQNPNRIGRKNWDKNAKNITLPATEAAKLYEGYGTRLKQTSEPIVLARKPLAEKTLVRNVLKYGTGALNVGACKIGEQGRFPGNSIISDEVANMLGNKGNFFYCPKVSQRERNAGCDHLETKIQNSSGNGRTYNDRCAVCGKKFTASEATRCQCPTGVKKTDKSVYKNQNHHPTVKPVNLMQYLVTLVTPPNGICLDIFMGSGTTGIACGNLGFEFIGIEKEAEYFEVAKARIAHWQNNKKVA